MTEYTLPTLENLEIFKGQSYQTLKIVLEFLLESSSEEKPNAPELMELLLEGGVNIEMMTQVWISTYNQILKSSGESLSLWMPVLNSLEAAIGRASLIISQESMGGKSLEAGVLGLFKKQLDDVWAYVKNNRLTPIEVVEILENILQRASIVSLSFLKADSLLSDEQRQLNDRSLLIAWIELHTGIPVFTSQELGEE